MLRYLSKPNKQLCRFYSSKQDLSLDARWVKMASKEIKGQDVHETLIRETNEQMLVKPIYTQDDWAPPKGSPELPGEFPFTRGPYATMYTHRPWTIR
jgi:methylmalonyl-CoA mutase